MNDFTDNAIRAGRRREQPRDTFSLWAGWLGPPLIWLAQFEAIYALADAKNPAHAHKLILVTGATALLLIMVCGLTADRQRRAAAGSPLDAFAGVTQRIRFMAVAGIISSALFFILTAAQWAANFFYYPGQQ
jgi:hypothetical protein